jgi:hypothetical protein
MTQLGGRSSFAQEKVLLLLIELAGTRYFYGNCSIELNVLRFPDCTKRAHAQTLNKLEVANLSYATRITGCLVLVARQAKIAATGGTANTLQFCIRLKLNRIVAMRTANMEAAFWRCRIVAGPLHVPIAFSVNLVNVACEIRESTDVFVSRTLSATAPSQPYVRFQKFSKRRELKSMLNIN